MAGLILAAFGVAGCARQPAPPRASVESCVRFGMTAVRQHVTATALPPACQGLTAAQIDSAVGLALRSAASGVRGKAQRRQRIAQASRYLAPLFVAIPAPHSEPQPLSPGTRWVSRTTLSLLALGTWVVTVALGLSLLARGMPRGSGRRRLAARLRGLSGRVRLPVLNRAHLGLAAVSLLIWVGYLAIGTVGIAWVAAGLLPLVAGLGMALVFLPRLPGSAASPGRRPAVLTIGAHVIFAIATILFAVLAVIGTG
jgi:hypothetical protein